MRVAIVGMGALGCVYGVRLAKRADVDVTFVVRRRREVRPLKLTRIDGDHAVDELSAPKTSRVIPPRTEAVLVCVRVEQLNDDLDEILRDAGDAVIVVLTPLLPSDYLRLLGTYGCRIRAGLPGVVSYAVADGEYRYWLPKLAPTLIDKSSTAYSDVTDELVRLLGVAGMTARIEADVEHTNPATTLSFIPLAMGIDVAGGIDALLANKKLLRLSLDAAGEARAIAALIGKAPAWVDLLARFLGPSMLKVGIGLARRGSPEALSYVEEHFGRKLHRQNVVMARAIVELSKESGSPGEALATLARRLEAVRVG